MKRNLKNSPRIFSLVCLISTALLFAPACGSDSPDRNNNTNNNNQGTLGNPEITVTYDGKTITADSEGHASTTPLPLGESFVTSTVVNWKDADNKSVSVVAMISLRQEPGKTITTGDYPLYRDKGAPDDGTPSAWFTLTGATGVGLPQALEAVSGTMKLESIKNKDGFPQAATYSFDAILRDIQNVSGPTYDVSGTIKFVFKMPANE